MHRLQGRISAKFSLKWPDVALRHRRRGQNAVVYLYSEWRKMRVLFRARVRARFSRTRRDESRKRSARGSAAGHECAARAGMAKPSASCNSSRVVWETRSRGLGDVRSYPTRFHSAFLKPCLHAEQRDTIRGCLAALRDDPSPSARILAVAGAQPQGRCPGAAFVLAETDGQVPAAR